MTKQTAVTVLPNGQTRVGDEPWPKEIRELAFELWWLKFNRDVRQVADYLNQLPDQDADHPADDIASHSREVVVNSLSVRRINTSTLYAWARREKWADEAEKRHRQIAPAIYNQVEQSLDIASIDAVRALIEIVNDRHVSAQTRQKAADSILDRTGHTAWVRPSDDGKIAGPQRDYADSISGKSPEDLMKMIMSVSEA